MAALSVAQRPACGHHSYGDCRSSRSSGAHPSASGLNSIVRVKADSCVTSTATLAQSTKMKAMCKRGRSSEVALAFSRRFHRDAVSCCQCCLFACLALLKACESFKEKALFCYRISAARKQKKRDFVSTVFFFLFSFARCPTRWSTLAHSQPRSLTPQPASSMLEQVEARHPAASCLRHGNRLSPSRLPLLQLLSLPHAAGVFLVRRASLES
jgi:hypothetical protein